MLAREWMHANHKRLVTVKFGPDAAIHTVDRKGQKLRSFSLKSVDTITVEKTSDTKIRKHSYVLLRHSNDYDLVLEFESLSAHKKFLKKLEDFFSLHKKDMKLLEVSHELILSNAETKERRQRRLEYFFREAYALTFGLRFVFPFFLN